ncbi:MAG: hypothetical protein AAGF94_06780 [Pseudomonadota bacterium]
MKRRTLIGAVLGLTAAPTLAASHSLYGQWVAYRQKHLLIGCYRGDDVGFELAKSLQVALDVELPEASARVARAPFPGRLARLLGTDQIPTAVLLPEIALGIAAGEGEFAPYGAVPLNVVAQVNDHLLVSRADFPEHHGALVFAALESSGMVRLPDANLAGLAVHPGVPTHLH